jgi:hypothetical protein
MSRPSATVSGRTFYAAFDPRATDFLAEAGIPEPTRQLRGRGTTHYFHALSVEQVDHMLWHLDTLIDSSCGWDRTPDTYADVAAMKRDATRLRRILRVGSLPDESNDQ